MRAEYPLKRPLDIAVSLVGLLLLLLPMAVIALLMLAIYGRPVFFRHRRPGLRGRPFTLIKFRTMRRGHEPDAQRMTRLGRFMRATSIDEWPELWNVLKGEMSLVGPRPLLMAYLDRYAPEEARRHEVRPGITGWAQVNGRNAIAWEQKFAHDVWYVDHQSLALDLKILLLTPGKVLQREGINQPGHATAEEFKGGK